MFKEDSYYSIPQGINKKESQDEQIENAFHDYVLEVLVSDFREDLQESGKDIEFEKDFLAHLKNQGPEEQMMTLSLPKALRVRFFKNFQGTSQEMVDEMLKIAQKEGFIIGYHASPRDINSRKEKDRQGKDIITWDILPTDLDDRDDRKMAYYSLDIKHVYDSKMSNYLYLVRVNRNGNFGHKYDNDGSWGRADRLSIISKVKTNKGQIYQTLLRQIEEKKKTT
jgi:hypothetical protein